MKILVVTANPPSTPRLHTDDELRLILQAATNAQQQDGLVISPVPAARVSDVRREILRQQPHVLHFVGHGGRDGSLTLEGDDGRPVPLSGEQLVALLGSCSHLRCVVMNACFTARSAQVISAALGVPCVGSTREVKHADALDFAAGFYDAVAAGQDWERAFEIGTASVRASARGLFQLVGAKAVTRQLRRQDDWSDAPDLGPLLGRDGALDEIGSWIIQDRTRLVAICGAAGVGKSQVAAALGSGGLGKTDLAIALGRDLAQQFDRIVWRRLLNAPDPADLIQQIVGRDGVIIEAHADANTLARHLTDYMRRKKTLLILDNYESVLPTGGDATNTEDPLGDILEAVSLGTHDSCIVLTSRTVPEFVAVRRGKGRPIRLFPLTGLDVASARTLMDSVGQISATDDQVELINTIYSGNPLWLDLVARYIGEMFDGDAAAFLERGRYAVDGVEQLLEWHVRRLTDQEFALAMLLAVTREPTSIDSLAAMTISQRDARDVTPTLQRLGRKLPLEHSALGWSLQPVLVEHLTTVHVGHLVRALKSGVITEHLRRFPAYLATSSSAVRQAHLVFIVNAVLAETFTADGSTLSGGSAARALVRTGSWAEESGFALGSLLNLMLAARLPLAGIVAGGVVREVDFTIGDARGVDLTRARVKDCSFHETTGAVLSLAASRAGEVLAVGTDGRLRAWSLTTGILTREVPASEKWLRRVVEDPATGTIITAGDDDIVRLIDSATGTIRELVGHTDWIMSVAVAPGRGELVSVGDDALRVWSLTTATEHRSFTVHSGRINDVAFDRTGRWMVTVSDDRTALIHTWGGDSLPVPCPHPTTVRRVAFVGDRSSFVTASDDGMLRQWDAATGDVGWSVQLHASPIRALAVNDDGTHGFSADENGVVCQWDARSGELVRAFPRSPHRLHALAIDSTSRWLASAGEDQTVRIWDLTTGAQHRQIVGYANPVWQVRADAYGGFATCSEDGVARFWSPDDDGFSIVKEAVYGSKRLRAMATSGDRVALGGDAGSLRVLSPGDAAARSPLLEGHTKRVTALDFSPDGDLVSVSADGTIRTWDLDEDIVRLSIAASESGLNSLAVSRRSERCWVAGDEGAVAAVDLSRVAVRSSSPAIGRIWSLALSPDETLLAAAGSSGRVAILDAETLDSRFELDDGHGWEWSVEFIDADTILTSAEDGTVSVWTLLDRRRSWSMRAHGQRVRSATMLTSGRIAAGSDDGTVSVWSIHGTGPARRVWPPRPYEGMRVSAASGLTADRLAALASLGAEYDRTD
jgi:WD40 repeat protein